jgi:protein YibB
MKSALLLTGNLRTFYNCLETFTNIIIKFNPDIYIILSANQFEYHPYQRNKLKLDFENDIDKHNVFLLFDLIPNFIINIKHFEIKPTVTNVLNDHDSNLGIDLYNQYLKFNNGMKVIIDFEEKNNLKYDYIIKTRFDLNVDIESMPKFPLNDNTIYTTKHYETEGVCDFIFISNNSSKLEKISMDVIKSRFSHTKMKNIHSLLYNIVNLNNLHVDNGIRSWIDEDLKTLFNTQISLVTCFFELGRDNWERYHRNQETYFENFEKNVAFHHNPLIIFTTPNFVERIKSIRQKTDKHLIYTKIIVCELSDLVYFKYYDKIKKIQEENNNNIHPISERRNPEFTQPNYIIVINNKIHFLKEISQTNPFASQIFQWIDFGIHSNLHKTIQYTSTYFNSIFYKKDKIKIVTFHPPQISKIQNLFQYYNTHTSTCSAVFIGGDYNAINHLYTRWTNEFDEMLNQNFVNQEQYIIYKILCQTPEMFDYSVCLSWDSLCEKYKQNNVKIGICFSGHLRSYHDCKDSIQSNIIQPLMQNGFQVDLYLSTWNNIGFRNDNLHTKIIDEQYIDNGASFKKYEIEVFNSSMFKPKYSSNHISRYMGPNTTSDAASMFYKIERVFKMSEDDDYDIILRMRPDSLFKSELDISLIKECCLSDKLYMPISHGKYSEVTKFLMDQFFFGNKHIMKKIMTTFSNFPKFLLETDFPHSAEGFLWKQIQTNNIQLQRFMISYGLLYKDRYLVLYE